MFVNERPAASPRTAAEGELGLRLAEPADAELLLGLVRESFAARQPVDPPADALSDTLEDVLARLNEPDWAVIAEIGEVPVGCLFVDYPGPDAAMLHRVSVLPGYRHEGVAAAMVRGVGQQLAEQGSSWLLLRARSELPILVAWWRSHGFEITGEYDHGYVLRTRVPYAIQVPTADEMRALGRKLAGSLRPGDLIIATGELGAGKTTLTQGIGEGMRVSGQVISPTFVLSRIHHAPPGAPDLVHVDGYRLNSAAELADLDLDASLEDSVTVVEWGQGLAEQLSDSRLEIEIQRSANPDEPIRTVYLRGVGPRWQDADWECLKECSVD